jgi:hypothetical protein
LLNSEGIDLANKEAYIERLGTKVAQIDCVTSSDDQKMLITHQKVDYIVENILCYFEKYGLTEELISFINSDAQPLDYLNIADESQLEAFLDKCIREEAIENEKYRQIMESICDRKQNFNVAGLSDEKVRILIQLGLIDMNSVNLKFMRASYPDVTADYIRQDIDHYITIAVGSDFNLSEATTILEWEEVSDLLKIDLLKQTTLGIEIHGKHLNDTLILYILENNLHEEDLPWIIEKYDDFSEQVRSAILRIASGKLAYIVENYSEKIGKNLLNKLFSSETADFAAKVQLLEATSRRIKKDQLCIILSSLGADKIADNISGGKRKVRISQENTDILKALHNAGVIHEPEKGADGQAYKTIRYKTQKSNESEPESIQ